ncbi:hypothetical protein PRIPAC_75567 [Pristionchus pacificus]|nr:hypothetical protein PRIPAC_75567 [Pristionchus pacificus]
MLGVRFHYGMFSTFTRSHPCSIFQFSSSFPTHRLKFRKQLFKQIFTAFLTYSMLGNIIIFGSITAILFILMLHIIIATNINPMSTNSRVVYRAKINNSFVVLSQMILSFCLCVVPLCVTHGYHNRNWRLARN